MAGVALDVVRLRPEVHTLATQIEGGTTQGVFGSGGRTAQATALARAEVEAQAVNEGQDVSSAGPGIEGKSKPSRPGEGERVGARVREWAGVLAFLFNIFLF